ncbi:MAG TPA: chromosomal replication initiator protein DnaA [Dictyobacter sp.]|nr:chromosomal replication initiator protein DnaA [Dictyobacter sp.]
MNAKQIWQTAIEQLQTKVSPAVFTTWFQGTSAISFQDGVFVIRVPTTFTRSHLEKRFHKLIRSILEDITGTTVEIQFVVAREIPDQKNATNESAARRSYRLTKGRLTSALRRKRSTDEPTSIEPRTSTPIPTPPQHVMEHEEQQQETYHMPVPAYQEPPEIRQFYHPRDPMREEHIQAEPAKPQEYSPVLPTESLLNPRYTFSTFIVGSSNKLAHATSLAVAENPGRVYNPLFLYGGVGLGKTHLLHAIGHAGETEGLTVLYTTSEKFTNEIVNAIRFQKTEEFRAKYRQIDILLVDDIQFIAGKESTEEEFFHTFNTLHNANKQIVVTSDRPPKAINSLQDRLRSRFEWGLLADVLPPEYEHRLAILRSKCESLRFTVPPAVIEYVARPACGSVRELEGALNRVIAYATLHDAPLSANIAAKALENIYDKKPTSISNLSISEVLNGISRYYNVDVALLRGKQRDRAISWPRQVAMYLMREETSASLLQIGTALGGRDHTTIMHGWEKVHAEIANNEQARQEISAVLEILHNQSL